MSETGNGIEMKALPMKNLRTQLTMYQTLRRSNFNGRSGGEKIVYAGNEDLILREGQVYEATPLPSGHNLPDTSKACFRNAYEAVRSRHSRWIYVEGFAINETGLAVHHAWLTRAD